MADKVTFELVAPERLLLAIDADMVVVPGSEGDFGVLAGHQPIISTLRAGAVDIYENDKLIDRVFVAGGFAEMSGNRLTILVEEATSAKEIDRAALPKLIEEARDALGDAGADEARREALESRLAYLELMNETAPLH